MINAGLEPLGLSSAEGDILYLLLTGSNDLQQEQLAEQLDIGKAAVSRAVDSLVSKGYVTRIRQQQDRRAYSVSLTDKALTAGSDIKGIYDNLYALVRRGIADDEFVRIGSVLSRVEANLGSSEDR
jgi:DNA-binding MarR family transcriptional regulator